MSAPGLGPLARLGVAARRGFGRLTPEPFVITVGLGALVGVAALLHLVAGGASAGAAGATLLGRWQGGGGLWGSSPLRCRRA